MYKNGRKDYYEKNRDKILEYRKAMEKKKKGHPPIRCSKTKQKNERIPQND
jgi:hypothetical protein